MCVCVIYLHMTIVPLLMILCSYETFWNNFILHFNNFSCALKMSLYHYCAEMDAVLLGFIDQPITDTFTVSWDTNKIGGLPVGTNALLSMHFMCIH